VVEAAAGEFPPVIAGVAGSNRNRWTWACGSFATEVGQLPTNLSTRELPSKPVAFSKLPMRPLAGFSDGEMNVNGMRMMAPPTSCGMNSCLVGPQTSGYLIQ
jgi:hypothetical protein